MIRLIFGPAKDGESKLIVLCIAVLLFGACIRETYPDDVARTIAMFKEAAQVIAAAAPIK